MRMPRYNIENSGAGPFAVFYCDKCDREYRSQPNIAGTVTKDVGRGMLGGFLRNIPVVGDAVAEGVDNTRDRYRTDMSQQELAAAWAQVEQYFHECPTCHQIVCPSDFDPQTGYCTEDSPRRQEIAQAQAQQAAGFVKGIADVFGVSDAVRRAAQQAQQAQAGLATCPNCGRKAPAGTNFCPSCGTKMQQPPPPQEAAPAAQISVECPNCHAQVPPGQKFCGNCGTKVRD